MTTIADAKQCDITGEYYPLPEEPRRYKIVEVIDECSSTELDLCPTVYEKFEQFLKTIGNDKPTRAKRKRRPHSPEARQLMSQRAKRAYELMRQGWISDQKERSLVPHARG